MTETYVTGCSRYKVKLISGAAGGQEAFSRARHAPRRPGMTIGQLAARTGVSPEAIRFYEREGVIPPAARGGAGRYRLYDDDDAARLRFVRRARNLGFSLEEVGELLALALGVPERPCREVNVLAKRQLARVQAKLVQLTALHAELDRLVVACDRDASLGECSLLEALSGADLRDGVD